MWKSVVASPFNPFERFFLQTNFVYLNIQSFTFSQKYLMYVWCKIWHSYLKKIKTKVRFDLFLNLHLAWGLDLTYTGLEVKPAANYKNCSHHNLPRTFQISDIVLKENLQICILLCLSFLTPHHKKHKFEECALPQVDCCICLT